MPSINEITDATQTQVIKGIEDSQKAILEAVTTWAKSVEQAVPAMPAIPALPFAENLPNPQELVESSFAFAGKLLAVQHECARNLFAPLAPVRTTPQAADKAAKASRVKETAAA